MSQGLGRQRAKGIQHQSGPPARPTPPLFELGKPALDAWLALARAFEIWDCTGEGLPWKRTNGELQDIESDTKRILVQAPRGTDLGGELLYPAERFLADTEPPLDWKPARRFTRPRFPKARTTL